MGNRRDPIVIRAINNVRLRYTPDQWVMLDVKEVTRYIYDEIRRLDLEAVQVRKADDLLDLGDPKLRKPRKVADDQRPAIVWAAE